MKSLLTSATLAASLLLSSADAAQFPALTVTDLNGQAHALTSDWRDHGGIVILGFAHGAREGMDQWAEALDLHETDSDWIELPVIGDVNPMVRPMIRSGMRARYTSTPRRSHVAPVFDDATVLRGTGTAEIEVLVIAGEGEVVARVEGTATLANVAAIRSARRR